MCQHAGVLLRSTIETTQHAVGLSHPLSDARLARENPNSTSSGNCISTVSRRHRSRNGIRVLHGWTGNPRSGTRRAAFTMMVTMVALFLRFPALIFNEKDASIARIIGIWSTRSRTHALDQWNPSETGSLTGSSHDIILFAHSSTLCGQASRKRAK